MENNFLTLPCSTAFQLETLKRSIDAQTDIGVLKDLFKGHLEQSFIKEQMYKKLAKGSLLD